MALADVILLPAAIAGFGVAVAMAASLPGGGAAAELLTWPNVALGAVSLGWLLLVRRRPAISAQVGAARAGAARRRAAGGR